MAFSMLTVWILTEADDKLDYTKETIKAIIQQESYI